MELTRGSLLFPYPSPECEEVLKGSTSQLFLFTVFCLPHIRPLQFSIFCGKVSHVMFFNVTYYASYQVFAKTS